MYLESTTSFSPDRFCLCQTIYSIILCVLCYLYHALFCKENEQTKLQAKAQLGQYLLFENVLLLDSAKVFLSNSFSFSVSRPNVL